MRQRSSVKTYPAASSGFRAATTRFQLWRSQVDGVTELRRDTESTATTQVGAFTLNASSTTDETVPRLTVEVGREEDGRWYALVPDMPGVMAYGKTSEEAERLAKALAFDVAADCLRHGEPIPEPLRRIFRVQ